VLAWRGCEETSDPNAAVGADVVKLWHQQPRLLGLLAIVAVTGFATALIAPIYLIYLQDKFDLSVPMLALCFFPAGMVFALLPIYGGRIADRIGYGRALAIGGAIAGLISGGLPFMPGVIWIAAFYTLFAVGWSLADPAEDALYASVAGESNRGQLFGYKEMSAGIGSALGPLAGGALYDNFAAHWVFVANGSLLLLCAIFTFSFFSRR
jgi:MFS family permease